MKTLIQTDTETPSSSQHCLQEPRHGGSLESKNLWIDEWMEKMQFVYTVEHYSARKSNKILQSAIIWTNPEGL